LLLFAPYLQLIPAKPPSLVSDRYVALAVWPAALLLVMLAWRLKPAPRAALLLAIALPWAWQTVERVRDWQSFEALIDADLRAYPGSYIPATYKINQFQLPRGLYREAEQTASRISEPEVRNMVNETIRSDYAVYAYAWSTGQTAEAVSSLLNLEAMQKHPPPAVKWNPSMYYLWSSIRIRIGIRWSYLAAHFPDDAPVRYNAERWLLENGRDAAGAKATL